MGVYKYIRALWKNPKANLGDIWKERLVEWRKEPATLRIEHPTRIDRARSLGYRAKQGFIIVRARLTRGGRMREQIRSGRRPKHNRRVKILGKNYQQVAEERVARKYPNCEVLNSYEVGIDGLNIWYEIILVDRESPVIKADKRISWITTEHGRAARGLTSAGRRSRGLMNKGKGAEKVRPSQRANSRLAK
jgi:large subunit ribosomal protein L15e